MMVEWGDPEDLFSISEFLARDLDDNGDDLENVDSRDDYENDESIRHHRENGESRSERESANVAHIELGRLDVIPEKGDECPDDEETNRCEDEESLAVADISVDGVVEEKKSAGESIESVGDVDGICHRDHREDEEGNVEPTDSDRSDPREFHRVVSELTVEPPRTEGREENEKPHLELCGETFRSSDFLDI